MRIGSASGGKTAASQSNGTHLGLINCQPFGGEVSLFWRCPECERCISGMWLCFSRMAIFPFYRAGWNILWAKGLKVILGVLDADNRGKLFPEWKHLGMSFEWCQGRQQVYILPKEKVPPGINPGGTLEKLITDLEPWNQSINRRRCWLWFCPGRCKNRL